MRRTNAVVPADPKVTTAGAMIVVAPVAVLNTQLNASQ